MQAGNNFKSGGQTGHLVKGHSNKVLQRKKITFWKAVYEAKDNSSEEIPRRLYDNGVEIDENDQSEFFVVFFEDKINNLINNAHVNPNVYNGRMKINVMNKNFMTEDKVCKNLFLTSP